ncbi:MULTISPECIES: sensor histidine kinase [unclassified Pseudoalteromonas]|uniref:sensor histidine kinase n=1 Tax=unclassified Pseudoalteromonas TaxID=194690 RepID=UPI003014BCB3
MAKVSLRIKTMIGTAVIEAVLLTVLIFVVIDFMMESANDAMNKRATTTTQLFASATKDALLSFDLATLDSFTQELLQNPDILYVKVLNTDKQIMSFAGDQFYLQRQFNEDNLVETVSDGVFDVKGDISEGTTQFGSVQIGIDIGAINSLLAKLKRWTISIALIEMFFVAVFSYVLGVYLTQNLYRLKAQAHRITENIHAGRFDFSWSAIRSQDELEELSNAFDELSQTLSEEHQRRSEYEAELKSLNVNLERLVAQRTAELKQQNLELEQRNQALAAAQKQLVNAEKMASVGQLAAGVAHEINNPLGFVMSNLEVMQHYHQEYMALTQQAQQEIPASDYQQALHTLLKEKDFTYINQDTSELLQESVTGLQRVTAIVKDLKQFSRADVDERQACDINNCIKTTLNLVENELKYHVRVITDLTELPAVEANTGKLIQVFTNLFVNAAQAMFEEGELKISTALVDDEVVINVADNGVGIDDKVINKIFDPFFTSKPVGQGTGLGLSISYDIIREIGGDISVASKEGVGTCFTITLPVAHQAIECNARQVGD